ncbi:MAG: glycosyltransferase, partial [Rhodospirillaceae bacterium]
MNDQAEKASARDGTETAEPVASSPTAGEIAVPQDAEGRLATILQVIPALGSGGGVERGTIEIAEAIVEAGGRAIVASAGGAQVHEVGRAGAEHVELPVDSKNLVVMYKNIGRLAELIEREKVDLVHVRSRAPAWSTLYAAKRTGRPMVTTFHGTYNADNFLKRAYNGVMTKGVKVIAISGHIAEHVRRLYGVPANRLRIIHRGVDLYRFDPAKVSANLDTMTQLG